MDEFILPIDPNKFRSTNAAWNNLMLNDPWSVGYVSSLIVLEEFLTKEEWEQFYYKSGSDRDEQIRQRYQQEQNLLNDEQLVLRNKAHIDALPWNLKNINFQFGRIQAQLRLKGELLYEAVKSNGQSLTIEDCYECVRFRVICETWNGIVIRESNTLKRLQQMFPNSEFRKVAGEFDHKFGVDYEVYKNGRLVYGIQIKPKSYIGKAPYIAKARLANKKKNELYTSQFGVPVYDIISGSDGIIFNQDIVKSL